MAQKAVKRGMRYVQDLQGPEDFGETNGYQEKDHPNAYPSDDLAEYLIKHFSSLTRSIDPA